MPSGDQAGSRSAKPGSLVSRRLAGAVRVHDPDPVVTGLVALVDDLGAVGGPVRRAGRLGRAHVGELAPAGAVRVDRVHVRMTRQVPARKQVPLGKRDPAIGRSAAAAAADGARAASSRAGLDAAAVPEAARTPAAANATTTQELVIAR